MCAIQMAERIEEEDDRAPPKVLGLVDINV